MLTDRQRLVLKAIVEEYVKQNEPVGSRTLSKRPELAFSPATLRNEMADLEELGYLEKTHTSSGRVPSESGYRCYVEEILKEKDAQEYVFPMIDEIFARQDLEKYDAINESMELVSSLTNYAAVVLGQGAQTAKIKRLEFVSLQDQFAVILMVTDQGHVESKRIIVPAGLSSKEISKVVNALDEILHDCNVSDIDAKLKVAIDNDELNDILKYNEDLVNAFASAFSTMIRDKYQISGQSNILSQPEFQDVNKVRELLNAIERKEILKIVKADANEITVKIGQENEIKAMQDCTVITVPYTASSGERGAIAIFGPTRMEYSKIIPLLEYIARNVKKVV